MAGVVDMKLEKDLHERVKDIKTGKSVSLGHLCALSQKASQALKNTEKENLLNNAFAFDKREKKSCADNDSFTQLRNCLAAVKRFAETDAETSLQESVESFECKQAPLKSNLVDFFAVFPQIRNRNAHPHYDVRDKKTGEVIRKAEWPLSDSYYRIVNPLLVDCFNSIENLISPIREIQTAQVTESDEKKFVAGSISGDQPERVYKVGSKLWLNAEGVVQTAVNMDYHLFVLDEALAQIEEEEREQKEAALHAQNKEQLKASIRDCLEDDDVIDSDEYNMIKAVATNNLGMEEEELKAIISKIASEKGIENPFPEVDPIYLRKLDEAIESKNFNRFKLKLEGERYGLEPTSFESVLRERCEALSVNIEDLGASEEYMLTNEDLKDVRILTETYHWLKAIRILNEDSVNSSLFATTKGNALIPDTKENIQATLWNELTITLERRLKNLSKSTGVAWDASPNAWNAGKMTGYYWLRCSPIATIDDSIGKAIIFYLIIQNKNIHSGLAIFKDKVIGIRKFPLMESVFAQKLRVFLDEYDKEIDAYPNFRVRANSKIYTLDYIKNNKDAFFKYHFSMDKDGYFNASLGDLKNEYLNNPYKVFELFEITFTLMSNILDDANNTYLVKSESYESPIKKYFSSINESFQAFCELLASTTKQAIKSSRDPNQSRCIDFIFSKRRNGYYTCLEYGFWTTPDAKGVSCGFRLRGWQDNDSYGNSEDYGDCKEFISEFDDFFAQYYEQLEEKVDYFIEAGFFCYQLPVDFENLDDSRSKVLEQFSKIVNYIAKANYEFLGITDGSPKATNKNSSRYILDGQSYLKGRLVLAVIQKYISDHLDISISQLTEVFPTDLQGSIPVVCSLEEANGEKYKGKRHFVKYPIELNGETLVVTNQWGVGNIGKFLEKVKVLGFEITEET
tara:strand:+ start:30 stop:2759 length:2730 start_codon:yes stop_codon:yes gene_type:complete